MFKENISKMSIEKMKQLLKSFKFYFIGYIITLILYCVCTLSLSRAFLIRFPDLAKYVLLLKNQIAAFSFVCLMLTAVLGMIFIFKIRFMWARLKGLAVCISKRLSIRIAK